MRASREYRFGAVLALALGLTACDQSPTDLVDRIPAQDLSMAVPAGDVAGSGTPMGVPVSGTAPEAGIPDRPVVTGGDHLSSSPRALVGAATIAASPGGGAVPDLIWQHPATGQTSI
jgi:hypothetical protein